MYGTGLNVMMYTGLWILDSPFFIVIVVFIISIIPRLTKKQIRCQHYTGLILKVDLLTELYSVCMSYDTYITQYKYALHLIGR